MSNDEIEKKIREIKDNAIGPEAFDQVMEILKSKDGLKFLRAKQMREEVQYEQALSMSVEKVRELLTDEEGVAVVGEMHNVIAELYEDAQKVGDEGYPVVIMTNLATLGWLAVWNSMGTRALMQAEEMAAE